MRAQLRRSFLTRMKLVFAVALILSGALPVFTGWAQDSGAATFTVASADGNVVIKRANGSSEMARPGTQLYANDQLASVGRSEATLNAAGPGNTSGASLLLFSDTTIGVRSPGSVPNSSGAGAFYVADIAQGVVVARTPPNSGTALQITAESAGAVAQVNPGGGMAVASDVGTGTIAVACDDRQSQVFFPYVDDRVPCENNVVRTLSNNRTIEDSRADANSPITAAVQAAGTNVAAVQQAENAPQGQSQGAANRSNTQQDDDDDDAAVASPVHSGPLPSGPGQPCNASTVSGGQGVTVTTHELGRNSGSFTFSFNAQFQPDQFEIFYEGQQIFTTGGPVSGVGSHTVSYSGTSTQIVVRVTGPEAGTFWTYVVGCPAGPTATPTPTPPPAVLPPTPTFTPTPTPTTVANRATSVSVTCDSTSCTAFVFASDGTSPPPAGQVSFSPSPAGRVFSPNPCTLSPVGSPVNVSSCTVSMTSGVATTITATYLPSAGFSSSTGFTAVPGDA